MTLKTIILIYITLILLSCGPRSGVHEEAEELVTKENIVVEKISPIEKSMQHGGKIFKQNCAVCHHFSTMKLTGPGLGGVLERLPQPSEEYLIKYITNNDSLIKKDSYAKKLRNEYHDVSVSHDFKHLTASDKHDLIVYIRALDKPIP